MLVAFQVFKSWSHYTDLKYRNIICIFNPLENLASKLSFNRFFTFGTANFLILNHIPLYQHVNKASILSKSVSISVLLGWQSWIPSSIGKWAAFKHLRSQKAVSVTETGLHLKSETESGHKETGSSPLFYRRSLKVRYVKLIRNTVAPTEIPKLSRTYLI